MTIYSLITEILPKVSEQEAAAENLIRDAMTRLTAVLEKQGLSASAARERIVATIEKLGRDDPALYDRVRADAERDRPKPGSNYRERLGLPES